MNDEDMPKVGVVLLNWNGGEFTSPCIESLLKSGVPPWRILVFDNGSTDDSPDRIQERFPGVEVVRHKENIGFAAGNNEGMKILLDAGADYIWVLNNDTIVHEDCLGTLLEAMQADPEIAVASAKILFEEPDTMIWYAGASLNRWTLRGKHRGIREMDEGQYDTPCDVDFVSGCCMFTRRSALETLGLFNNRYFMYIEDSEWCLRATRAGLRKCYIPAARLWHKQHATVRKHFGSLLVNKAAPFQEYFQCRNFLFMLREHAYRPLQLMTSVSHSLVGMLYRACGLLILGRWKSSLAILKGIGAGLTGDYRL